MQSLMTSSRWLPVSSRSRRQPHKLRLSTESNRWGSSSNVRYFSSHLYNLRQNKKKSNLYVGLWFSEKVSFTRNGFILRISDSSNGILWIIHRRHFVTLADLSKGAKFGFRFIKNRCLQIHRMAFVHIYRMTWVDSSNGKVPNWFEVPSLSASTWKIMEMSNNILLTSTIFRVLVII